MHLHELVWDADDPDPEQRRWKVSECEGAILALERLGVLSSEEAASWRERVAGAELQEVTLDPALRAAAREHATALIDHTPPLKRQPSDEDITRGARCVTAIDALHAIGAITNAEREEWQRKRLAKEAPWLDELPDMGEGMVFAVAVPPATEGEAEEDRKLQEGFAARPMAERVNRVIAGSADRHHGLAIVAVVVHEDATSVHFHHLGEPIVDDEGVEGFTAALHGLSPPQLRDDQGTEYVAIDDRPAHAHGPGGPPDVPHRRVLTGAWQYKPTAPTAVRQFHLELNADTWTLLAQDGRS